MVKNQDRARNLRDASVLPDLCNSHERQLTVLLKNQQRLSSIRKRIAVAKDELGCTLLKGLR
jgi:RB1-inducible coiled-coil protein 1